MSLINRASLLDSSLHSRAILELLELEISRDFIDHLIQITIETVAFGFASSVPLVTQMRGRSSTRLNKHAEFRHFVSSVVSRSELPIRVLLVAIVYLHRSKNYLFIESEEWACHRVFLGALIIASKYTNDATLKNVHWATINQVFNKRDIARIERDFLAVLDWELGITESDILAYHDTIMSLSSQSKPPRSSYCPFFLRGFRIASTWIYRSDSDDTILSPLPSPQTPSSPSLHPTLDKSQHHKAPENTSSLSAYFLADPLMTLLSF